MYIFIVPPTGNMVQLIISEAFFIFFSISGKSLYKYLQLIWQSGILGRGSRKMHFPEEEEELMNFLHFL